MTYYTPGMTQKAREFCLLTKANDEQLAEYLGVSVRTIYRWKNGYSEFCQAVEDGKRGADISAVNAFFRRVLGYEYEEVRTEEFKGEDGQHVTKIVTIKKHMPPDVQAGQFWLTNRHPDKWRIPANIEFNASVDVNIKTPEELEKIYQEVDQKSQELASKKNLKNRGKRIANEINQTVGI